MPPLKANLHGNAADQGPAALLLMDVINDLEFPGGEELLPQAMLMAQQVVQLKEESTSVNVETCG